MRIGIGNPKSPRPRRRQGLTESILIRNAVLVYYDDFDRSAGEESPRSTLRVGVRLRNGFHVIGC